MNRAGESGHRQDRQDKKRDIKPTVSLGLKDLIYRVAFLTKSPVKDVGEYITALVLRDRKSIEYLSPYFKRDLRLGSTLYMGSLTNKTIVKRNIHEPGERVTIRFKQREYASISDLSYAMDCTPSRTVAVLLELGMKDIRFVNDYIKYYLRKELTNEQMRELREIIIYTNEIDEDADAHHSWASLLEVVEEEVGPIEKVKDSVNKFLVKHWRQ